MSMNDLYQEVILDHYKNPRNSGVIEPHTHECDGDNPLCGDQMTVYLEMDGEIIKNISFVGMGCAISQASASLMTEQVKGKSAKDAMRIYEKIHYMLTGRHPENFNPDDAVEIGKLKVLEGVAEFPARVKCASLAWHTLKGALDSESRPVSTEGDKL